MVLNMSRTLWCHSGVLTFSRNIITSLFIHQVSWKTNKEKLDWGHNRLSRRKRTFIVSGLRCSSGRGHTPRELRKPLATGATCDLRGSTQLEALTAGEGHLVSQLVQGHLPTSLHRVNHCRGGACGRYHWWESNLTSLMWSKKYNISLKPRQIRRKYNINSIQVHVPTF